jgi:hypothetical protein
MILESFLLPGNDRTGLHERQGILPARPQAREPAPEHAIGRPKPRSGEALLIVSNWEGQNPRLYRASGF